MVCVILLDCHHMPLLKLLSAVFLLVNLFCSLDFCPHAVYIYNVWFVNTAGLLLLNKIILMIFVVRNTCTWFINDMAGVLLYVSLKSK